LESVRIRGDVVAADPTRRGDHPSDPVVARLGGADVEVGTERPGDFVGEERSEAAPGDPLDDLAEQIALADRVVARLRARLPPRCLAGVDADELVVVE
jgi:hypothetical protein